MAKKPENPMPLKDAATTLLNALTLAHQRGAFNGVGWETMGMLAASVHKLRTHFKIEVEEPPETEKE